MVATVGTPDYFVVTGTVAAIATFNAAVEAQILLGYAPVGIPYTDGTDIEQVMFKGNTSSFVAEYPIIAVSLAATAGFHIANVGGAVVGATATGLANDATVYTASVIVDGGNPQQLSVVGSAAQTYTTLLAELNTDTDGATWALSGGNVRCISDMTGLDSGVMITDGTLFDALTLFTAFFSPVLGVKNTVTVDLDYVDDFQAGYRFTITGSTGNDGLYTVAPGGSVLTTGDTVISTVETLPSAVADGFVVAYGPSANQG